MNMISKLLKNRWALSTVVTTLIILVISVLLASVVTYFAINVVSTRVQEESLHLTKQHIWHNATATPGSVDYSQASLMVINTGGRDVVIDKISVRGQECDWNNTDGSSKKFVLYSTTTDPISGDMEYVPSFNTTGTNTVTLDSTPYTFSVASSDLVLKSGYTLLIYIVNPDSIAINDVGLTVGISIYTAQAVYYRETNVEAVAMQ
jgi:hypothetical protein